MTTNEAIAHCGLDDKSKISTEFLYFYLRNFNYEKLGSTSSIATAVNSKSIRSIPVLLPCNNFVLSFNVQVKPLLDKVKMNQKIIENLSKTRDELLPRLISGSLKLPESLTE